MVFEYFHIIFIIFEYYQNITKFIKNNTKKILSEILSKIIPQIIPKNNGFPNT